MRAAGVKNDCLDKLAAALDDNEKMLFDKYCSAQGEIEDISQLDAFSYALKFGILLMIETFMGNKCLCDKGIDAHEKFAGVATYMKQSRAVADKSLLRQLYDGDIFPAEQSVPQVPEYRELSHKLADEKSHFREPLSNGEQERFDEMWNISSELGKLQSHEDFAQGFRLGARLMIETLTDDSE